jgi:hypothetical protein
MQAGAQLVSQPASRLCHSPMNLGLATAGLGKSGAGGALVVRIANHLTFLFDEAAGRASALPLSMFDKPQDSAALSKHHNSCTHASCENTSDPVRLTALLHGLFEAKSFRPLSICAIQIP